VEDVGALEFGEQSVDVGDFDAAARGAGDIRSFGYRSLCDAGRYLKS
jgi:hypothetical protein